jgi:hypothetical protein
MKRSDASVAVRIFDVMLPLVSRRMPTPTGTSRSWENGKSSGEHRLPDREVLGREPGTNLPLASVTVATTLTSLTSTRNVGVGDQHNAGQQ